MTKESAYVTLLTNESYLPGALTLGQKLKELKTVYKLAILIDASALSPSSVDLLKTVYDDIIPIDDKVINAPLDKLVERLGRSELSITFTKVLLWNQSKYDTLVYLDSDTLPLASLDHLFEEYKDLPAHQIVASPDSGWPDIFNSGVFVLKPDEEVFGKLLDFTTAENNTFDGADQGLLNEFFNLASKGTNWIKLPYIYNVTPNFTNAYQYYPALTRFFDDIKLLHFIGSTKPWHSGDVLSADFDNFHQYWWGDFNKFYANDAELKAKLLSLPKGEAYNLKFDKYSNKWDAEDAGSHFQSELSSATHSQAPIFPWEHKEERTPTRSFDPHPAPAEEASSGDKSKVEEGLRENIESLSKTKLDTGVKSPPLSKSYGFDKESKDFNPDKSLDEVSKLPLKFLTKNQAKKEEDK
ncbi:glycogenin glucosyltransferase [Scheffersomyces xylosifermentans]|uniref:glycogenin glucosyltransferase n=1 Tax=Scheffersomyces xylosifermentans TaxID=1304137 RepID=UPI00315CDD4F